MILDIVGANFRQREAYEQWKDYWKCSNEEKEVQLVRVSHPEDPNCIEIRVVDSNLLIGYVKREVSKVMATRIDTGKLKITSSRAVSRCKIVVQVEKQ